MALIVSTVPSADPSSSKSAITTDPSKSSPSSVPTGSKWPYMIFFIYTSPDGRRTTQKTYFPDKLYTKSNENAFSLEWDKGEFGWDGEDRIYWKIDYSDLRFEAHTRSGTRVPWKSDDSSSTPAGIFARFPLPIQWHVHSVDSICDFKLEFDTSPFESDEIPQASNDKTGQLYGHIEKNWALSFPTSYIWIQARDHENEQGVCLAGGSPFRGVEAYLAGFQGKRFINFAPPTSTNVLGFSLGLNSAISFDDRSAKVTISGWFTKLVITAKADPETFFELACPFPTGHLEGYSAQSFAAEVMVQTFTRRWPWRGWTTDERKQFSQASFELGGDYYKSHAS